METARVEDVVGDFVRLQRAGSNLKGLCPFHNEKTPSFSVSPAKNIYKCFGCGEGGGPVQFMMQHENMSFPEAIRFLANRYKIELQETVQSEEAMQAQQERDSLFLINQFARDFYQKQLFETDRGKSVGLSYFKKRGFSEATLRKFGLGYAPAQKDAFLQEATKHGYPLSQLKALGLVTNYGGDFFRDRVMFTIRNLSGKVIAFAGRIMQKEAKAAKYVNSPETEIYHKSKVLYGMFQAKGPIRKQDECILVEGYTDVISLHQAGVENVVASSGTALTVDQIRLIKRFTPNVKILYDGDAAGIKAALRGLDLVLEQDLNVKVVLLPDGEDPDSYLQKVGSTVFKEYLEEKAEDFIVFKAGYLMKSTERDPIAKSNAIKDIVGSISKIPDPLKRSVYIKECSNLTGVSEEVLYQEVNKNLGGQLKKNREDKAAAAKRADAADTRQVGKENLPLRAPEGPNLPGAPVVSKDYYQERDVIRILVAGGDQYYDENKGISVGRFLLMNMEDILEDFQDKTLQKLAKDYLKQLEDNKNPGKNYFINHPDESLSKLSIDLMSSPHEYSENWEKKHEVFLDQNNPEENFIKDAEIAIKRLKIRKIKGRMEVVKKKISTIGEEQAKEMMTHLRLYGKYKAIHDQLAKDLGSVIT